MKKKIVLLIALALLVPSLAFAVVVPSCPPADSSNNYRPVPIVHPGEKPLQDILDGVFGAGAVDADNDQRIPGMWSVSYSGSGWKSLTVTLRATYAGNWSTNKFGIWSRSGGTPSEVIIFNGCRYQEPEIVATLAWNSSDSLTISSDSDCVNKGTFSGISPCSFGFFLKNPAVGTFYTLDSLNTGCEAHALAYNYLPNTYKWAIAFEDLRFPPVGASDQDYNDLVVIVDSLHPEEDADGDGYCDYFDNCPQTPNGPLEGTCVNYDAYGTPCQSDNTCGWETNSCSKNQEDSNTDGLGDACSGKPGSITSYNLEVPQQPVLISNIPVTTTFYNDTGHEIVTIKPDCTGNTTFTMTDSEGNTVLPIDLIRKSYAIGEPDTTGSDVITIAQGGSVTLPCNLAELFPPEAGILVGGKYDVKATYSNYIQRRRPVGGKDLWMGAINSIQPVTMTVRRYTFSGFFTPLGDVKLNKLYTWKAGGAAVPVKWKITGPNGEIISDPSSFAGLYSYKASCSTWETSGDRAVENASGGALSPQYLGGGNWQFNWNTPKSYATAPNGPCRVMELKLNDNSTYTARFQFK